MFVHPINKTASNYIINYFFSTLRTKCDHLLPVCIKQRTVFSFKFHVWSEYTKVIWLSVLAQCVFCFFKSIRSLFCDCCYCFCGPLFQKLQGLNELVWVIFTAKMQTLSE